MHSLEQSIGAKGLAIEEEPRPETFVEMSVVSMLEDLCIDPEVSHEPLRHVTKTAWTCQGLGASVSHEQPTIDLEFVTRCMAAEVIVIVQHQNPRFGTKPLTIEVRGTETAQSTADHD
ncbi:MAG: hypothetical protein QM784_11285 [Polyangiaceae bacterium]